MELSLLQILSLAGAGVFAGLVAGFAGVGGGIVMVPVLLALYRAFGLPDHAVVQAAMATSLTVAVFNTGSSVARHQSHGRVLWRVALPIVPSTIAGAWFGSWAASHIGGQWLQAFLAVALVVSAVRLAAGRDATGTGREARVRRAPWWQWLLVGLGVGLFAGFSGLAGGVVLVPALALIGRVPSRFLAGTSSGVVCFSSLAAALGYMAHGPQPPIGDGFLGYVNPLAALCLGATAVPMAQVGAWLNRKVASVWFRRTFAALLFIVAVRLVMTL